MVVTIYIHGIFASIFAYLFVLLLSATVMQNSKKDIPSIILARRGLLVKIFITLERHGIFYSNFANIIETQECKNVSLNNLFINPKEPYVRTLQNNIYLSMCQQNWKSYKQIIEPRY